LEWTLDAVETGVAVTASPVRYHVEYTGDGAAANIGLRDPNGAGYGAITFTDFQIERAPTGNDPLPYIASAEPVFVGAHSAFSTDDYNLAGNIISLQGDKARSILVVFRRDNDTATHGLLGKGGDGGQPYEWTILLQTTGSGASLRSLNYTTAGSVSSDMKGATATIPGLWHIGVATVTADGTHHVYLDGALDDGTSSAAGGSRSTGTAAIVVGNSYKASANYLDGDIPLVIADDTIWTAAKVNAVTCDVAQQMWDERKIPVFGALANCPTLSFD
jgi:hypothetical protein